MNNEDSFSSLKRQTPSSPLHPATETRSTYPASFARQRVPQTCFALSLSISLHQRISISVSLPFTHTFADRKATRVHENWGLMQLSRRGSSRRSHFLLHLSRISLSLSLVSSRRLQMRCIKRSSRVAFMDSPCSLTRESDQQVFALCCSSRRLMLSDRRETGSHFVSETGIRGSDRQGNGTRALVF